MGYYVNVEPNVKIYVEDLNPTGKKTILFLHGWPGSHKLFEYQFNQLPMMGYRCIGIDTRGFGNSDKPWRGYDYDRLADDVRCVIDTLKLHDIILEDILPAGPLLFDIWQDIRGMELQNTLLQRLPQV